MEPNWPMYPDNSWAAPSMAWAGSNGLIPRPASVPGMICMIPSAPAELTTFGSKSDSCLATAVSRVTGTPYFPGAWTNSGASVAGTPPAAPVPDTPAAAAPDPLTNPAEVDSGDVEGTIRRMATGVPTGSILTSAPVYGASTIIPMPTWPGDVVVPSLPAKNTRSPGCAVARLGTAVPTVACSSLVRGRLTPRWP